MRGDLAEKIHRAESVKNVSKPALLLLCASLDATPFTGGARGVVGVAALTATTGMSIVAISAVAFLGLALILSVTNGYDRKCTANADGMGEASMELNNNNYSRELPHAHSPTSDDVHLSVLRLVKTTAPKSDALLLSEVFNRCPRCGHIPLNVCRASFITSIFAEILHIFR